MPFFEKYGLALGIYDSNFKEKIVDFDIAELSKGLVREVYKYMTSKKCKINWKTLHVMLKCPESISVAALRRSTEFIFVKAKDLRRAELDRFLSEKYELPQTRKRLDDPLQTGGGDVQPNLPKGVAELLPTTGQGDAWVTFNIEAYEKVLQDIGKQNVQLGVENRQMSEKVKNLESEVTVLKLDLKKFHPHRVHQQLRRKITSLNSWKAKYQKFKGKSKIVAQSKEKVTEIKKELTNIKRSKTRQKIRHKKAMTKAVSKAITTKTETNGKEREKLQKMKTRLEESERVVLEEQEKLMEMKSRLLNSTKEGRAYSSKIRHASYVLQNFGVSQKNTSKALRAVYRALTGEFLQGKLPSYATQNKITKEMKLVSRLQVNECLNEASLNTLKIDATTKPLGHLVEMEIETVKDGPLLIGMDLQAGGTAAEYTDTIQNTVKNVKPDAMDKVSNIMSDRVNVNTAMEDRLENVYSKTFNRFKCNLHPLDTIASTVDKKIKDFENGLAEEKSKVMPFTHGGESNTRALVRTASKLFNTTKYSCRPEMMMHFKSNNTPVSGPLYPRYVGNRFHIYFLLAGKLKTYKDSMINFFDRVQQPANKVHTAVYNSLQSEGRGVTLRALGLAGKFITGPWMRMVGIYKRILETSEPLYQAREQVSKWATDPSPMLRDGTPSAFKDIPVQKDTVYNHLMEPCDDTRTKLILKTICEAVVQVMDRQLKDHFPNGKFWNPSTELQREAESCTSTNISAERTFAMADREMFRAPNAQLPYIESRVMFRKNRTLEYMEDKSDDELKTVIDGARRGVKRLRVEEKENEERYEQALRNKIVKARKEKLEKEDRRRIKVETWLEIVIRYGFSNSNEKVDELMKLKSKTEREKVLRAQINVYTHVVDIPLDGKFALTKISDSELAVLLRKLISKYDEIEHSGIYDLIVNPLSMVGQNFAQKWTEDDGSEKWYEGEIQSVNELDNGVLDFLLVYNDGHFCRQQTDEILVDVFRGDMDLID